MCLLAKRRRKEEEKRAGASKGGGENRATKRKLNALFSFKNICLKCTWQFEIGTYYCYFWRVGISVAPCETRNENLGLSLSPLTFYLITPPPLPSSIPVAADLASPKSFVIMQPTSGGNRGEIVTWGNTPISRLKRRCFSLAQPNLESGGSMRLDLGGKLRVFGPEIKHPLYDASFPLFLCKFLRFSGNNLRFGVVEFFVVEKWCCKKKGLRKPLIPR